MLSCEFCEIFKNTFFIEHIWWLLLKLIQVMLPKYMTTLFDKVGFSKVLFMFVITYLHEKFFTITKLTCYSRGAVLMQYYFCQKQPSTGALGKRCSENMHIFKTPFPKNTPGGLLLFWISLMALFWITQKCSKVSSIVLSSLFLNITNIT